MPRTGRTLKTLKRKISDLDDHLYFLYDSLVSLHSNDEAYFKLLVTELRVLVCKSSGTEGLLWRILNEINIEDAVYVHAPGQFDLNHPLCNGLIFFPVPVYRGGLGDPRLLPGLYSLKEIIKEHHAALVDGVPYTHEKLICASAQQIGSAHEDEGVEKFLVSLLGNSSGNMSALYNILMLDADLVIEVGRKALDFCSLNFKYNIKKRQIRNVDCMNNTDGEAEDDDFVGGCAKLPPEGTIVLGLNHNNAGWLLDDNSYNFPLYKTHSISIICKKLSSKVIDVEVVGFGSRRFSAQYKIPATVNNVMLAIIWTPSSVKFCMNSDCFKEWSMNDRV